MKGDPSVKIFFQKKSHRAENTLRQYPLASLSFLDYEKILLRKLIKNCKKSGPLKVRLSAEKTTTHCNSRAFFLKGKGAD